MKEKQTHLTHISLYFCLCVHRAGAASAYRKHGMHTLQQARNPKHRLVIELKMNSAVLLLHVNTTSSPFLVRKNTIGDIHFKSLFFRMGIFKCL